MQLTKTRGLTLGWVKGKWMDGVRFAGGYKRLMR